MQRTSQRASHKATHRTTQTSRSRKTQAEDAIMLLTEDHKKVQKIFKDFEKIKDKGDDSAKAELVQTACQELTIHAQVEEEIFYPAVREVIKEEDLIDEAAVEHASVKQLIGELESMQPGDELYDAKFTVLGEYVNHHIKEEQNEIFPKAKKGKLDLVSMAEEIHQRKQALQGMQSPREEMQEPEGEEGYQRA